MKPIEVLMAQDCHSCGHDSKRLLLGLTRLSRLNDVPNMSSGYGVHASGGLVQENNVGISQQCTGHAEPALHASAVAAASEPAGSCQAYLLQQLLGLLPHQLPWQTLQMWVKSGFDRLQLHMRLVGSICAAPVSQQLVGLLPYQIPCHSLQVWV